MTTCYTFKQENDYFSKKEVGYYNLILFCSFLIVGLDVFLVVDCMSKCILVVLDSL